MSEKLNFKQFDKTDLLRTSLILLIITFFAALFIGLTNGLTYEKIERNNKEEQERIMRAIIAADTFDKIEGYTPGPVVKEIYKAKRAGLDIGYAVMAYPQGFGGEIAMVAAFDVNGTIEGIDVIKMSETPGIGTQITDDTFKGQFKGKNALLKMAKRVADAQNEIVAVSGATISSTAVLDGVNEAIKEMGAILKATDNPDGAPS